MHPQQRGKLTIATLAKAREQQAATRDAQFSPDQSHLILESPSDISSPELEIVRTQSVRPRASFMQEPKWQMVTPPTHTPSTTASSLTSDRKLSPSSPTSSTHSNLSQASQDDDPLENSANMNPVELSIARQISVSRQQRKMLKPLQTAFSTSPRPRASPLKSNPVPKIAMGKNERLAETKAATPTLVVPGETNESMAQHRKSERIVLEGA